jgi:hypothetical protein
MCYTLQWHDEQVLRLRIYGPNSAAELKAANREAAELAGAVRGLVHLIVDLTEATTLPQKPQDLWQLGDPIFGEAKIVQVIFVGLKKPLLRLVANSLMFMSHCLVDFVPDLATADRKIHRLRRAWSLAQSG